MMSQKLEQPRSRGESHLRVAGGFCLVLALLLAGMPANAQTTQMGTLLGKTRRTLDGSSILTDVFIFDSSGREVRNIRSTSAAGYNVQLKPGTYFAVAQNTGQEIGKLHGGGPFCFWNPPLRFCEPTQGSPIVIRADEETLVDFFLIAAGFIEGTVFAPNGQTYDNNYSITVLDAENQRLFNSSFRLGASFRVGPLPPGPHAVLLYSSNPPQIYPDKLCQYTCNFPDGEPVAVRSGQSTSGINFHLHDFGKVVGRVLDRMTGSGLEDVDVWLWEPGSYRDIKRVDTGPDGRFSFADVVPGNYLVSVQLPSHEGLAYPGISILPGDGKDLYLPHASPLTVSEAGTLEVPTFELRRLGRLLAQVVDPESGESIAANGQLFTAPLVRGTGYDYELDGQVDIEFIPPGTYYLVIDGPEGRDMAVGNPSTCLAPRPGEIVTCDVTLGRAFEVGFDQVVDVGRIELPKAARLRGTVWLEPGRVGNIQLEIFSEEGRFLTRERATPPLRNATPFDVSLPAGTYYLRNYSAEHLFQAYSGFHCVYGDFERCLTPQTSTPVTVGPGEIREGLDFFMKLDQQPCRDVGSNLCLGDGRFTLRTKYRDPLTGQGDAKPNRISRDTGYLTFFDDANVEVVVKILNACDAFGELWIYATGLTDVETSIQVRDNWAAKTVPYFSYGPFRTFKDHRSFDTCDLPEPEGWPFRGAQEEGEVDPGLEVQETTATESACGGDPASSLCLGNRFRVELEWTTADGSSGPGLATPLTADTGFFYFFSPDNIEVVVKTLNACGPSLNNHFWFFAAGMTDVAVTLRVLDTLSGQEKIYLSPLGQPYQSVFDLEAFATCP